MCIVQSFLSSLYKFLTDSDVITNQVVKVLSKDLKRGDVSFPLDLQSWHVYRQGGGKLFTNEVFDIETLVQASQQWSIAITSAVIEKKNVILCLERHTVFDFVLKDALCKKDMYGTFQFCDDISLIIPEHISNKEAYDLTELKVVLLKEVCSRFLQFVKFHQQDGCSKIIGFTNNGNRLNQNVEIICGPVITKENSIVVKVSAEDFLDQRIDDMRMMAEHKYQLRMNSKPGWKEFFRKLGDAAVHVDLLRSHYKRATIIDLNDHYVKTASFILYNCARIFQLLKQFQDKVEQKIYTIPPNIEDIDFTLLKEPEEWELVYVYILRFPELIHRCFAKIAEGQVEVHLLIEMLSKMTSVFSSYYRRVRILRESREYLLPVLHARIYLVQAVHQVMLNALFILDIDPVNQM